jgi:uncharacterized protein (DUF4415 family)
MRVASDYERKFYEQSCTTHKAAHRRGRSQNSQGIASDPDTPKWTEQDFKNAQPFAEVFPELAASVKRARGRPAMERPRKVVSLRMDQDVLDKFRASGKGWQSRVNEALRKACGL